MMMSGAFKGQRHGGRERPPWVQAYQSAYGGMFSLLSGASLRYLFSPGWDLNIHLVGFYPYGQHPSSPHMYQSVGPFPTTTTSTPSMGS
jgi:hypothetical protein